MEYFKQVLGLTGDELSYFTDLNYRLIVCNNDLSRRVMYDLANGKALLADEDYISAVIKLSDIINEFQNYARYGYNNESKSDDS
jgi:hypothetical protein